MRHHTHWRRRDHRQSRKPGADAPAGGLAVARAGPEPGRGVDVVDRKAMQLSHQVAETLQEVLADCADPVLQALRVLDVEPAPDASRLLVTLAVDDTPAVSLGPAQVSNHVARAAGHLRSEVASAITRKRAPVLVYRLAAPVELPTG